MLISAHTVYQISLTSYRESVASHSSITNETFKERQAEKSNSGSNHIIQVSMDTFSYWANADLIGKLLVICDEYKEVK